MDKKELLAMTADIVSAHASINEMNQEALLAEIQNVFAKLSFLGGCASETVAEAPAGTAAISKPIVPLEAAFGKDKVFCMICGRGMKTLKRHLNAEHGLKPGQYRKQFGIPSGTKLVAADYAEKRKAISAGLNLEDRLVKARAARKTAKKAPEKAPQPEAPAAPKVIRRRAAK